MRGLTRLLPLLPLLLTGCSGGPDPDASPEATSSAVQGALGDPSLRAELLPQIADAGTKPAAAASAEAVLHVWPGPGVGRSDEVAVRVTGVTDGKEHLVADELTVPPAGVGVAVPGDATYRVQRVVDGRVTERPAQVSTTRWQTAFEDQFSGTQLAPVWQVRASAVQETCATKVEGAGQHGRNRNEFTRDMVRVTGGVAVVGVTDRAHSTVCPDGRILRRSGHVGTEQTRTFSGARFVLAARVRMPAADGPHSAFWMRGIGPASKTSTPKVPVYEDMAEMDIVESFGPHSNANCSPGGLVGDNGVDKPDWAKLQTNFYYNYQTAGIAGFRHCISNTELSSTGAWGERSAWDGYHVYAVDWVPNRYYRVWMDGVLVRTFQGAELSSGRASFLALSQLIDDGEPHYSGPETQKAITVEGVEYEPGKAYLTPQDLSAMKVDWVRVWRAG